MPSQALVDAHRTEVSDIVAVAQAELVERWSDLPLDDARATQVALAATTEDLVAGYGTLAAGAGADFYREARVESGVRGRFTPALVVPLIREQIKAASGWAVGPLFGEADPARALSRMSGVVQRLTVNAERQTIIGGANNDPEDVRWYRGTSANACSFCALIASRAVSRVWYRSQETADFDSHNSCRCFPVPFFTPEPDLPDYYEGFYDEYLKAAQPVYDEIGATRLRPVLSEMRRQTGRA